jgi:septal ring factor EnvC (AmiA/AmiB activator)
MIGKGAVEYTIGGIRIPRGDYTDFEIQNKGKRSIKAITSEQLMELKKSTLFDELVKSGKVEIDYTGNTVKTMHKNFMRKDLAGKEKIVTLTKSNENLSKRLTDAYTHSEVLDGEIKKLTNSLSSKDAELQKYAAAVEALSAENKTLKEQLEKVGV